MVKVVRDEQLFFGKLFASLLFFHLSVPKGLSLLFLHCNFYHYDIAFLKNNIPLSIWQNKFFTLI